MAVDMRQHFTTGALLRYAVPSIGMMVFMSVYVMVDGFFVSRFVGATALAAVNFAFPVSMFLGTIGYMLGTGGGALVAKIRGEGDEGRANQLFSLFVYAAIVGGLALSAIGQPLLRPVLTALGARGDMLDLALVYGRILVGGLVFDVLQYIFQGLVMTAGKPRLGFWTTVAAGITNIGLDALLVGVLGWGVMGAAAATVCSMAVGGLVPLAYFARPNTSPLRLGRAVLDWRALGKAATNGLSEMVGNLAMSIVSILYNVQLLTYIGDEGVAAFGVVSYVSFLFSAVFMGHAMGVSPLISFQYGAHNQEELQSLFKKNVAIFALFGVAMFLCVRAAVGPLTALFVGYDADLQALTVQAMSIYSFAFLFMGLDVFGSALFTALNNGLVSALISFLRTFLFEIGFVLLLPRVMGASGIWTAAVLAELAALVIAAVFVLAFGRHYGYLPSRR